MDVSEAFAVISRAIDSGHSAHGYLVCGDLCGCCDTFADRLLLKLFPGAESMLEKHEHPDVATLEPEGKARTIHVASMRERIVEPMAITSFSGGWKVGIIVSADRMELSAANAFLKLLEEPPAKTMFLLLTDSPDAVLPTIVSRTQRVDLPLTEGVLEGDAYDEIAEIFETSGIDAVFEKAQAGKRLAEILAELKDEAEDTDVARVRKAFFKTIMSFVRRWMVEDRLPRFQAFRNVEAVEEACRQSDRSLNDEAVLCFMTDRMTWPEAKEE